MRLGSAALPPQGFVAFCERRPTACGDDAMEVLKAAARADADRAALFALLSPGAAKAASVSPSALSLTPPTAATPAAPAPAASPDGLLPFGEVKTVVVERAASRAVVVEPAGVVKIALRPAEPVVVGEPALEMAQAEAAPPAMTPELWAKLNNINARVNRAIRQRTDADFYGQADFWATPIEDGQKYGDCEDYVLEKQRALLEAGVPRRDLNIALVTTSWGESHAVLLVNTSQGEFVLDNLSRWVSPWQEKDYTWRQRQVDGDAFHWVMSVEAAPAAPSRPSRGRLLIASAR